jgi:hypothetical protein
LKAGSTSHAEVFSSTAPFDDLQTELLLLLGCLRHRDPQQAQYD